MLTLPFASLDSPVNDEMKQITRTAILEVNNAMVVPMKILDVVFEDHPKVERTDVKIEVEDCLDLKEWQLLRNIFVLGANCQQSITKSEVKERLAKGNKK